MDVAKTTRHLSPDVLRRFYFPIRGAFVQPYLQNLAQAALADDLFCFMTLELGVTRRLDCLDLTEGKVCYWVL